MQTQQEISRKKLQRRVGITYEVVVDGHDEQGRAIARSYARSA